ncbi:MAG: ABC transporter permease [Bacteroidales bacterium]|nr:ABC transporter permease [Bacteroidales bacterium]MBN2699769.1 ABC transporter permease [Bacteroidales bacterium]
MSLIKNYFLSLYRNLVRGKFFSILNLLGLATGIAASILIFIYIQDELTFDKHNEHYNRIFRLEGNFFINGKQDLTAIVQIPLGPTLKDEFPEIEEQVRILPQRDLYFEKGTETFKEDSVMWCDSTIFRVFTLDLMAGDPSTALNDPYTMVVSESLAMKYFGTTDVIGNSMKALDGSNYQITGVFGDLPDNVHLRFNGLLSATTIEEQIGSEQFNDRSAGSFWNVNTYSYVLLSENTTPEMVLEKFPGFYDKYMASLGDQINASFELRMTPLSEVHYQKDNLTWDLPKGNMNYIYILVIIAIFLIIIASINYMNLTTARAASRGKEIGIRKIGGADKRTIRFQFLGESLFMALLSGILASIIVLLVLGPFNDMASKMFTWRIIFQPAILAFILGVTLLTGLLSGIYPSFYLASFNPVNILKGSDTAASGKGWLRRGLVIVQFIISAVMIIGSIAVSLQLRYIRNKDLGFDRDNIICVTLNDSAIINNISAFREEIERHPSVEGTSLSTTAPGRFFGKQVMTIEGAGNEMVEKAVNLYAVDYDYADVMGLEIVRGRFYDREFGSDQSTSFVINEAAVWEFNWEDDPLGKKFIRGVNIEGNSNPVGEIIGVVKDFNYGSLHNPIEPLVLICVENANFMRNLSVRFRGTDPGEVLSWIGEQRRAFHPAYPFQYSLLSDELEALYRQEKTIFALLISFSILILFIASLGLLGLSAFMTVKRTHETGIRRVLGASQNQILSLFIFQFSKWVFISNLLAWPLAYLVIKNWLRNFTYRIDFPFWSFIISLLVSMAIAVLTVSWHSLRASRMNPATSVKRE